MRIKWLILVKHVEGPVLALTHNGMTLCIPWHTQKENQKEERTVASWIPSG